MRFTLGDKTRLVPVRPVSFVMPALATDSVSAYDFFYRRRLRSLCPKLSGFPSRLSLLAFRSKYRQHMPYRSPGAKSGRGGTLKLWNRSQALTGLVVVFAFGRLLSGCGGSGGGGTGGGGGGVQIPAAPTGVIATPGNAQVVLTWGEVSSGLSPAPTFRVKRSTTSGGPYTQVGAPTATTYTDTGLTNGTTYYYVVSAVNSAGESANSSEVTATPVAPPAAPTGVSATPGNAQVVVAWTASTGATGYHVKRGATSGGPYTQVGAPTASPYTDTGLTNGTPYY